MVRQILAITLPAIHTSVVLWFFAATSLAQNGNSEKQLDAPHRLLAVNRPMSALRLMNADPTWINRRYENQCTPLHVAARFNHVDVIEWLLVNGADINAVANDGLTPLHFASVPDVVKVLLDHEPDLTIECHVERHTPLQHAVDKLRNAKHEVEQKQWRAIVDLYLAAGAELDLQAAIEFDDLERVKAIFAHGGVQVAKGQDRSGLRQAASMGRFKICRYLVAEQRMDVDQFEEGNGYPIILDALQYPEVVQLLVEHSADLKTRITWRGGRTGIRIIGDEATVLHFAAEEGVPETIKMLIDAGVEIFATTQDSRDERRQDQTALDVTAFFGMADNAKAIIEHPKFSEAESVARQKLLDRCLIDGAHSSRLARNANRAKLLEVLLENGAKADARDKDGVSAIQVAAQCIRPDNDDENLIQRQLIDLLVRSGGELDLYSAIAYGDEAAVQGMLKENPKLVDLRARNGYPALHLAVAMNFAGIVRRLIDSGADINIRSQSEQHGDTPLHCAAFWGRLEIAKMLLDAGANINARNEQSNTPLHEATRMSKQSIRDLLIEYGAKQSPK